MKSKVGCGVAAWGVLAWALCAGGAQAAIGEVNFITTLTGPEGARDLTTASGADLTFDEWVGVTRRQTFVSAEWWAPETSAPFRDENGQWVVRQEGTQLIQGDEWHLQAPSVDRFSVSAGPFLAGPPEVGWQTLSLQPTTTDPLLSLSLSLTSALAPVVTFNGQPVAMTAQGSGPSGLTQWRLDLDYQPDVTFSGLLAQAAPGADITSVWVSAHTARDGNLRWVPTPVFEQVAVSRLLPVPEPSTWAMATLGLLAWGFWGRQRTTPRT
jgi:PEP-CTERM motif